MAVNNAELELRNVQFRNLVSSGVGPVRVSSSNVTIIDSFFLLNEGSTSGGDY